MGCASGHSELAESGWKSSGLWAIGTSNPNSWTSAEELILPRSAADALLLQEIAASCHGSYNCTHFVPTVPLGTCGDQLSREVKIEYLCGMYLKY